jgi:hypothetical protein
MVTTDEVKYKTYKGILKPSQRDGEFFTMTYKGVSTSISYQEVIWLVDEDSNEDGLSYINKEEFLCIRIESSDATGFVYIDKNYLCG